MGTTIGMLYPEAYISVQKGRKKIHNLKNVYLEDETEFEIELFNPTLRTVLAKISINGSMISYSGIVLKPGERVFLDRFLHEPKKFKFETYDVENSVEALAATANNGLVRVDFYYEQFTTITLNGNVNFSSACTITTYPIIRPFVFNGDTTGGSGVATFTTNMSNGLTTSSFNAPVAGGGDASPAINFVSCSFDTTTSNATYSTSTYLVTTDSVETGRVEKGSNSDQQFTNVYNEFENFITKSYEYKLIPVSQKPVEKVDIVKNYCTMCRTKLKPKYKFCPTCGEKN